VSEHPGRGDRPPPAAPPPVAGWPDLPGWASRPPDPAQQRAANPIAPQPTAPHEPPAQSVPPPSAADGRSERVAASAASDHRAGSLAGAQRPTVAASASVVRGPRRARLTVRRVDPWSVLRFSFLASLVLLVVFVVAVMVLYGVLAGMHVFSTINDQLRSLTGTDTSGGLHVNFSFGRVLGITLVIGVVNVVLFTALATLGAFVYNLVSDLVGGIEVVLTERD